MSSLPSPPQGWVMTRIWLQGLRRRRRWCTIIVLIRRGVLAQMSHVVLRVQVLLRWRLHLLFVNRVVGALQSSLSVGKRVW